MSNFLKRFLKNPYVLNLLLACVVVMALIGGTMRWLNVYTRHNIAVIVPDVKGMDLDEAEVYFKNNELSYVVIDSVFSKDVKPGVIVEVVPGIGSKVKEGRIVYVTVNAKTSQMASIPEVEDLSLRQAYALLQSRGFTKVGIEYVPGDFKDLAMAVKHQGKELQKGEYIPVSDSLYLIVSSGEDALPVDSLLDQLDEQPVQSLGNEDENWF